MILFRYLNILMERHWRKIKVKINCWKWNMWDTHAVDSNWSQKQVKMVKNQETPWPWNGTIACHLCQRLDALTQITWPQLLPKFPFAQPQFSCKYWSPCDQHYHKRIPLHFLFPRRCIPKIRVSFLANHNAPPTKRTSNFNSQSLFDMSFAISFVSSLHLAMWSRISSVHDQRLVSKFTPKFESGHGQTRGSCMIIILLVSRTNDSLTLLGFLSSDLHGIRVDSR